MGENAELDAVLSDAQENGVPIMVICAEAIEEILERLPAEGRWAVLAMVEARMATEARDGRV